MFFEVVLIGLPSQERLKQKLFISGQIDIRIIISWCRLKK